VGTFAILFVGTGFFNASISVSQVHTLGDLHKFDPTEIGLMEGKPYGKLTGFYERQIATMKRTSEAQVAAAKVQYLRSWCALFCFCMALCFVYD
jgi:hypothetical protein